MVKRTYDESGDYCVNPFEVFMKESLNDQVGNKGLFTDIQTTPDGNVPSEDLMIVGKSW